MAFVSLVTDVGLSIVTNLIKSVSGSPKYIAYGTGTTEVLPTNTVLEIPAAEARTSGTETQQTTNTASDTYRVVGSITCAGGAKAITEVGLFDNSTGGSLFMHANFAAINLSNGDSIQFTISTIFNQNP